MRHDVFISYSSQDENIAHDIVDGLEKRGLRCWIASSNIAPSNTYVSEIMDNLKNTKMVLLIFSKSSNQSTMVEREIERAVSLDIPILPVMIDECSPSLGMEFLISSIQWFPTCNQKTKNYIDTLSQAIFAIINQEEPQKNKRIEKKTFSPLLITTLVLLLIITIGGYQLTNIQVQKEENCPQVYTFGTAAIVGNYYKVAENLREINLDPCLKFELKLTQGSGDNANQLIIGAIDLGLAQMDVLQLQPFINRNIAVLAPLYHEELHLLVRKDSPIKSFKDLKDKRINAGEAKSGSSITGNNIYENCFHKKMKNPSHTQLSEALDNLRDGDIDAIITVVGSPAAAFEKRKMNSFKLIPFDIPLNKKLSIMYEKTSIKYDWMINEVQTISTKTLLISKYNHKKHKHLIQFIKNLKGIYRDKLIAHATNDINTPLMKWHDRINNYTLPKGLRYHPMVKALYIKE